MTRHYLSHFPNLNRMGENPTEASPDFRELFENASDIIFTTDQIGNFTSINRTGERLTGYSRAELVVSNLAQIVAPESLGAVLRMMDQVARGASPVTYELDVLARDGCKVPLEVSARPIYRDGKPVGLQGIARDMSLRKQADRKMRERAAHLEALNAVIAAADAAPDLPLLLEVAIDRILGALSLGMGGIWVGDHHVVRGLSPEIGTAIVEATQGAPARISTTLSVADWSAAFPDGLSSLADTWTHIGVRASLTVPIMAGGRCVGALAVASAYPRPWTGAEVVLAEAVAQQVSATAEGLRLFQETQQRARLMGRLIAFNDALNRPSSSAGVATAIGQAALDLSDADGCAVYSHTPEGTFTCLWAKGVSPEGAPQALTTQFVQPAPDATGGAAPLRLEFPGGHRVEGPRPILVPDILELPQDDAVRHRAEQEGYRALAVWPMASEGRVIAGVCCYYDEPRTWAQPEKEVFLTFTWQAVSALKNAWLYEAQAERSFALEALYGLSSQLRAAGTFEEISSTLVEHAARLLHADQAVLSLLDADRQKFTCVHALGGASEVKDSITPVARAILSRVTQTRMPHITEDIGRELQPDPVAALRAAYCPVGPVIVVALQSEREVIGTIAVGRTKGKNARPFTQTEVRLLQGIAEMGGTAISRSRLFHNLEEAYIQMVLALARAMDARDAYTGNHSERLAMQAEGVAQAMGIPEEEVRDIRWAALLHDIGKIGSPDGILSKPGPLTESEWAIMQQHPAVGEGILLPVARMQRVARIVRHHQEKWDGTGYPDGLRDEAIPLGARILAVVDAYGAITDERPYKIPSPHAEAEAELKRCAGTQFDPKVVEVFCQMLARKEKEPALEFTGASASTRTPRPSTERRL